MRHGPHAQRGPSAIFRFPLGSRADVHRVSGMVDAPLSIVALSKFFEEIEHFRRNRFIQRRIVDRAKRLSQRRRRISRGRAISLRLLGLSMS